MNVILRRLPSVRSRNACASRCSPRSASAGVAVENERRRCRVATPGGAQVPLAERATVTRLVSEDNRDRAALYAEIARGNGHPEWEARIRQSFARRWIEHGANPGWYYKDAGGQWQRK